MVHACVSITQIFSATYTYDSPRKQPHRKEILPSFLILKAELDVRISSAAYSIFFLAGVALLLVPTMLHQSPTVTEKSLWIENELALVEIR
jgi:hypothetical protein